MQQYEREYLRIVQIMQSSLQGPTRPDAGQAVRLERDIKEAEDLVCAAYHGSAAELASGSLSVG